ncbi:hypothetical protein cypCar_00021861 [Cyprinus carpio]|nr:hypothetical protein cypCar_00021861 [Cyprinus carpio]
MRDTPLSNCERLFLLKAIEEKKRLDGRQTYDYRNIKITFGTDYGCCSVELGKTRYLVWQIRVDVHVLNHDGNLMDAASIAAISALSHFRRPDVAIQGRDVTVFSPEERDPIPLSIYHMPICVSFAFFLQGSYLLVDPCEREERVKDGLLVIAMNKHREICSIQSSGGIMLLKDQVLRCSKIASVKVSEITELINKALENDRKIRKEGGKFGFAESMPKERITTLKRDEVPVEMTDVKETASDIVDRTETTAEVYLLAYTASLKIVLEKLMLIENVLISCLEMQKYKTSVPSAVLVGMGTAQIGEGIVNSWALEEDEEDEPQTEDRKTDEVMVISDSEEEEVVILHEEAQKSTKTSKQK